MPASPEISTTRPFAGFRLPPCGQQLLQLLFTPDERGGARTQHLEPAGDAALANDPPAPLRLGEAGELPDAEILHLEQGTELTARRIGDDKAIQLCQRLQPGGEVGRLADDAPLLRRTLAD